VTIAARGEEQALGLLLQTRLTATATLTLSREDGDSLRSPIELPGGEVDILSP
jgi:hypothetical protein